MKKLTIILILTLILTGLSLAFEGGDGSSGDPYQVSTCQQLQNISGNLSAHYEIVQNIDCEPIDFNPIGDNETGFTGSLDGNQNIIWNLKIDGVAGENVGLIARNEGNLQNIRIQGAEVYGEDMNGGILAAENVGGIINRSMSSGIINHGTSVGGLVGKTRGGGIISRSYAVVYVDSQVQGGLAGALEDSSTKIRKSYAAGQVTTDGYPSGGGGLVGDIIDGSVRDSYGASDLVNPDPNSSDGGLAGVARFGGSVTEGYYDQNISDLDGDDGNSSISGTANPGVNLTTQDMTADAEINMNGLDFSSTWQSSSVYYPQLSWQEVGSGTSSDPYMIEDCRQLQAMENDLDAHYQLANDIDCSITEKWNNGKGFDPVGDSNNRFRGILNGDGHVIYDLHIDRPSTSYETGLFGYVASTGDTNRIRKIGLERVNITGNVDVGGIIGQNDHNIETVRKSYVTGNISGSGPMGGIIGTNFGQIIDSYAHANIDGSESRVGGLVGLDSVNPLVRTYFTGSVNGNPVVGREVDGQVNATDTYWDIDATGIESNPDNHGADPRRRYEMTGIRAAEYMDGFDFSSTWDALDNDRYPELQVFNNTGVLNPRGSQPPALPNYIQPADGDTGLGLNVDVAVDADHPDNEITDVELYNAENSVNFANLTIDNTDVISEAAWNNREPGTSYQWYAFMEDETPQTLNTSRWIGNWEFTTLYNPERPDNPDPANNSFNVQRDSNLSVDVYQEDGRDLVNDLYITDDLEASKDSFGLNDSVVVSGGSGTADFDPSFSPTLNLENGTQYRWFVNSSFTADGNTFYNESEAWNFTTSERPEVDEIMPANGESGVNPEPGLNVSIDHYSDVEVEFFDASDDSKVGEAQVQNGWANLTGYNDDLDTVGQQFWYVNATADKGETWSNQGSPWNFTVSDVQNLNIDLKTPNEVNRNNGSADIGTETLEAYVEFDGDQEIPIKFEIFDSSENSIENVTSDPVSSGENASIQLSDAGLEQDKKYNWTAYYEESGNIPFGRPDQRGFSTFTLDADWQRQPEDEGEEIEFYVSTASNPGFPGDYQKVGTLDPGSDLSGLTKVASSNIEEGDVSVAARVSNPLASSVPIEESYTVSAQ